MQFILLGFKNDIVQMRYKFAIMSEIHHHFLRYDFLANSILQIVNSRRKMSINISLPMAQRKPLQGEISFNHFLRI